MADHQKASDSGPQRQMPFPNLIPDAGSALGDASQMAQGPSTANEALRRNWEIAAAATVSAGETMARALQVVSEDMNIFMAPVAALQELQHRTARMIEDLAHANLRVTRELLELTNPTPFARLQQRFAQAYMEAVLEGSAIVLRAVCQLSDEALGPIERQVEQQRQDAAFEQHGHVLVVDDDPDVARVAATFLRRAGFEVTTVNNADKALAALGSTQRFDALITDHAMPGMRGADLILHARELHKAMPAMIITGYAGAEGLHTLPPDVAILRKPFHREELVSTVQRMVQSAQAATRLHVAHSP